jgi:hypothetical protein
MLATPGAAADSHVVNFYDSDDELLIGASRFLADGLLAGEAAMAVATARHREALAALLTAMGLDVGALEDDGLYVPLDAATVMRSCMVDGSVDRELARKAMLPFLLAAASKRRPLRAYGEISTLALQTADLEETLRIERIRNELANEFGCSLYCAYPSRLVQQVTSLHALDELCAQHSTLLAPTSYQPGHGCGGSPVPVTAQSFLPVPDAATAARNFVLATMRGWETSEFVVGTVAVSVMQVLTHLQQTHLRAFRVGLSSVERGVRVQIEYPIDIADEMTPNYQGFALLDRVTKEWGAEHNRDTRVIWAVFS